MNISQECKKCNANFLIEPDDVSYYEKIGVCHPDMCPQCRARLRLSFRNERVFYKRPCDKCKRDVVSMYSPNKPFTVWCYDCWFSDDWDASGFALEHDPQKTFFEQLEELWKIVPKIALIYIKSPGSEYINISADNKNCYMIVESSNNEDSIHSYWVQECNDVVDTSFASKCELVYESDDCYNSYKLFYSKGCHDSNNSYFLTDCRGCMDCIGCINLRQRQYYIFNEPYSKEEYEQKIKEFRFDTYEGVEAFRKKYVEFVKNQPRKFSETIQALNSTGNYMKNVKNCTSCFHCYDAEDNKYGVHIWRNAKDTMDSDTAGRNASLIYNSINAGLDTSNYVSCVLCWSCTFMDYSMYCFNSNYCFGSIGLRKKNYYILNKQYTKESFDELKIQIITEMKKNNTYGQFFPSNLSCFGYNESAGYEQFPLSKEEALAQGFKWEDTSRGTYGKETKKWEDVPESINEIDFDVVKEVFVCKGCEKNYRIIQNEFNFYKKLGIPLPRLCPDCRHNRRFAARGPNKLWHRTCMKEGCGNEFETSYDTERPEIVYCESCYQQEIM